MSDRCQNYDKGQMTRDELRNMKDAANWDRLSKTKSALSEVEHFEKNAQVILEQEEDLRKLVNAKRRELSAASRERAEVYKKLKAAKESFKAATIPHKITDRERLEYLFNSTMRSDSNMLLNLQCRLINEDTEVSYVEIIEAIDDSMKHSTQVKK